MKQDEEVKVVFNTLDYIVLEGCISQYIRLLYWRDASLNTLDYCIGGMHLQYIRLTIVMQGCISQYIVLEGCMSQYIRQISRSRFIWRHLFAL